MSDPQGLREAVARLQKRADTWSLNNDDAWVNVKLGDLRALLASQPKEEGWRLVPITATPEMLIDVAPLVGDANAEDYRTGEIALFTLGDGPDCHGVSRRTLLAELARDYRAMIAAAPLPIGEG